MTKRIPLVALFGLVGLAAAVPATAGTLDDVVSAYQAQSQLWLVSAMTYARPLLGILATVELALTLLTYTAEQRGGNELLVASAKKLVLISFLALVITQSPFFLGPLVSSAIDLGAQLGSFIPLSPSRVVDVGIHLATLFGAIAHSRGLSDFTGYLVGAGLMVTLFGVYCLVAVRMTFLLVETAVSLSIGLFFLAFGAFRATATIAEGFLLHLLSLAIRITLTTALGGVIYHLSIRWAHQLSSVPATGDSWEVALQITAGAIALCSITVTLPSKLARDLTSGSSPFGLQRALSS